MTTTTDFHVTGMTCEHCVRAVSDEVGQLSGVVGVEVDLPTGAVRVRSQQQLERAAVAAAVDEAGYELAT